MIGITLNIDFDIVTIWAEWEHNKASLLIVRRVKNAKCYPGIHNKESQSWVKWSVLFTWLSGNPGHDILRCYNQSLASGAGPLGQPLCHPVTERGGGAGGIGPDIIRKVQHSRGLMEHQVAKLADTTINTKGMMKKVQGPLVFH